MVFLPVPLNATPTLLQTRDCFVLPVQLTPLPAMLPSAGEMTGVGCATGRPRACRSTLVGSHPASELTLGSRKQPLPLSADDLLGDGGTEAQETKGLPRVMQPVSSGLGLEPRSLGLTSGSLSAPSLLGPSVHSFSDSRFPMFRGVSSISLRVQIHLPIFFHLILKTTMWAELYYNPYYR